jgi:hypothetical protein
MKKGAWANGVGCVSAVFERFFRHFRSCRVSVRSQGLQQPILAIFPRQPVSLYILICHEQFDDKKCRFK